MFCLYSSHAPAQNAAYINAVTFILFSQLILSAISSLARALCRPFVEANRGNAGRIQAEIDELKGDWRGRTKTVSQLADELNRLEKQLAELSEVHDR